MAYENYFNQNYQAPNVFVGIISEDGTIYNNSNNSTSTKERKKIGIDNDKEQEYINQLAEQQELLDLYFNTFGALPKPKTNEEIIAEQQAEQAQINKALLDAITSLKNEISEIKNNNGVNTDVMADKSNNEFCEGEIGDNSESDGKIATRDKSGNRSRKKSFAQDTAV